MEKLYNSPSIFISYRRKDAGGHAGRLYDRLLQWFAPEDIFYDQSGIESGEHFPSEIQNALDSAQAILVVVGADWLSSENRTRLDDEKDFVRREVARALSRRNNDDPAPLVVPVLVGGATQFSEADLPEALSELALFYSHEIRGNYSDYNRQVEALYDVIGNNSRSWVDKHSLWMRGCFSDSKRSFVGFGQNLAVLNPDSHYIARNSANAAMECWWSEWKEHHKPFVLLGEEGDGKSWALASWVANINSMHGEHIPVIFISTTKVENAADFVREMAAAMARATDSADVIAWEKRLTLTLHGTPTDIPKMLLIMDGLNERPSLDWRDLFDKFCVSSFRKNIAMMVSCRNGYWQDHLAREYNGSVCQWQISPFNNGELDLALARHTLTRAAFSDRVLSLVAKPRYFDMAVRLKAQLEESGDDVTVDRLIYEDWKDRIGRKRSPTVKISHAEFLAIITELAQKYKERIGVKQIAEMLTFYGNQAEIRDELVSSGILKEINTGKYEVASNPLILGFGLLLANEVEEFGGDNLLEVEEFVAERLGCHSDSDRLVQICAMALFHALLTDEFPDIGRIALFKAWIAGRNLDQADSERIGAYFPLRPHIYFQVMEALWGSLDRYREVEDHMMSALLQKHNYERVKSVMVTTLERWFGFVHPLGYRGWFEREEEKKDALRKDVSERLGRELDLGVQEICGYHIEVIAQQRLMQLAQVAESVISHLARDPFIEAICNGAVATAIMGGSLVDYRWVVRTGTDEFQKVLLEKARTLIATGESIALRAADSILFWLCSEEAIAIRDNIPDELSYRLWYRQFQEEDRSNSVRYLWRECEFFECLKQTKLAPLNIAENLREVAINPLCVLPEDQSFKIDGAIQQIDLAQTRSHLGQTRVDIAIRDIEPVLCAYKPEQYSELYRTLAQQFDGRDDMSCRLLAYKLYEQLPILTDVERELILKAWRLTLVGEGDEAASAEIILFPMVIFNRTAVEQLSLLLERGNKTGYSSSREAQYQEIQQSQIATLVKLLDRYDGSSSEECIVLLWYLSKTLNKMDEMLQTRLMSLLTGDDTIIRYLCLELFCNTDAQQAAQAVIASDWKYNETNCDYENSWGSILLARFATGLSFSDLADRISLQWLGYAVKERGNNSEEVKMYAALLHTKWLMTAEPSGSVEDILRHVKISMNMNVSGCDEDISIDINDNAGLKLVNYTWGGTAGMVSGAYFNKSFDPKVAEEEWEKVYKQVLGIYKAEKKRGNHWIDSSFSNGNLDAVVASGVTCWREWITPVLEESLQGRRLLAFCQGLYESLCATLLNQEPETGATLFKAIMRHKTTRIVDSTTDIQHLLFSLFEANETPPVRTLWDSYLDDCDSDKDLSEIAYLAQSCGKTDWLDGVIQCWLISELDYDKARALRLLGFSKEVKHGEQLQDWVDTHGRSWLMDVAKNALTSSKRNAWARSWVERFIVEEDRVKSWAAFRLFLRCVDKRFWIWGQSLIKLDELPPWKKDAYRGNVGTIMEAIKENEKKLKDTFIAHEVKENQLWPWMKRYL